MLWAYSNGVNDFLTGVGGQTAYLLPPEFLVLGHTSVDPWHPVDSLTLLRLINFHLSYNWS
jgi:acyl-homoserine lactone acylase PvdQ